jgi:hypothetical protein
MGIMTHMLRAVWRPGFAAVACTIGVLVGGLSGCRREEAPKERDSVNTGRAPASSETTPSAENRVLMETLEPGKWVPIDGAGEVEWDDENRAMRIGVGTDLNGVRWTGPLPTVPYVMELEARRLSGSDFFCGLTFPVRSGKESVSLILGGWGGSLVGISSIDGLDASENSTGSQYEFEDQRWYRIRVEVGEERLQAWIDDRQVVDVHTEGQKLSLRVGPIEDCAPLGLATWLTSAEVRGMIWRKPGD